MNTPLEAFKFTMEKVEKLRELGIEVIMKPSKSKENPEVVKKYDRPDRIPPELWTFVTFKIKNKSEAIQVYDMANYLAMCGIGFDTGGGCEGRDWELDWSFQYNKGDIQEDLRDARMEVEDLISDMECGNFNIDDENEIL